MQLSNERTDERQAAARSRAVGTLALAGAIGALGHHGDASAQRLGRAAAKTSADPATRRVEKQLTSLEKAAPSGVSLLETGSTLFYPLISTWAAPVPQGRTSTTAGTGSGTGIADALNGTVQIGASDAYLHAVAALGRPREHPGRRLGPADRLQHPGPREGHAPEAQRHGDERHLHRLDHDAGTTRRSTSSTRA